MRDIFLLITTSFILFFRSIFYDYVCDDRRIAKRPFPPYKNIFHKWWIQFTGGGYYNCKLAHIETIILHTIVCVMIYFVFKETNVELLSAIIFMVNPVNSEVSVWISGRMHSFATIILLSMCFLPWIAPLLWATILYFINPIGALFPLIFIFTKFWWIALCPILLILFYKKLYIISARINKSSVNAAMREFRWRKLILLVKTYGYYTRVFVFPIKIGFYHSIAAGAELNDKFRKLRYKLDFDFWVGVVVLTALTAGMIFGGHNIRFGLFWYMVCLLPFSNLIIISQAIAFRYAYLAYIGLSFAMANILITYPLLAAGVIGAYIMRLLVYMPMYRDEFWFGRSVVSERPREAKGWIISGIQKTEAPKFDFSGALLDFNEAISIVPWDFRAHYNAAMMQIVLGDFESAGEHLKEAQENYYETDELDNQKAAIKKGFEVIARAKETGMVDINNDIRLI